MLSTLSLGRVYLVLPARRRIQFVSKEIQSLRVTVTSQSTGNSYVQTFNPPSLQAVSGGSAFTFSAINLLPDTYVARIDAYLDVAETEQAGTSTSTLFGVTSNATTTLQLPNLTLASTPTGDWAIAIRTTLSKGYSISSYQSALREVDGTAVTGPSGSNPGSVIPSFTWGNVEAAPTGLSTTSVTVVATHRGHTATKTQVATISIQPGATVSSTIAVSFP